MNFIARCPACRTCYKVVPDQLRISDGWVRCGQCSEVFDASQQLTETNTEDAATPFPAPEDGFAQTLQLAPDQALLSDQRSVSPDTANVKPQASSVPEESWTAAVLLVKPSTDSESDTAETPEPDLKPLAEPVSFMREPDGPLGTLKRSRPVLWWGLAVALVLGLSVQVLYREREWMAARFPELKPVLQSVCDLLGCRLSPLQGIEHLKIDSATFQQVDQEIFELRLVVKNKAPYALALPGIELTLTDLADQPVMRRVFMPAELGAGLGWLESASDWSVSAYLRIQDEMAGMRAQGYRVLIFYP